MQRVLPVIHLLSPQQAAEQAEIALDLGADGVFLIDHAGSTDATRHALDEVRARLGDVWVGANLLSHVLPDAIAQVSSWDVQALWGDDAQIDERRPLSDQPAASRVAAARSSAGFAGEVFGGVAFKYQRPVASEDLPTAARLASEFLDVVTTSGPATGRAASLEKLRALREGVTAPTRLAVASGVDAENITAVMEIVDDVLVASSVCRDFHHFDPPLLRELLRARS